MFVYDSKTQFQYLWVQVLILLPKFALILEIDYSAEQSYFFDAPYVLELIDRNFATGIMSRIRIVDEK